jgi:hypothetical protein
MSKQKQLESLGHRPTRVKDGPIAILGGEIVNSEKLRKEYFNGMPEAALDKLVRQGMPVIRLPSSARNWFRPASCLQWFAKFEHQKNQPRRGRHVRS